MPKQKTHKGLAKRFKVTARGKVVHHKAGKSHLLSHKSGKRKRSLRKPIGLDKTRTRLIRQSLSR